MELIRPLATERGIRIRAELKPTLCRGDSERLSQVTINLLSNAVLHHNKPDGGEILVALESEAGSARLSVVDDGPGIPSEHLPRIFERFHRADASRSAATGGSGLGLSIVKGIVEAHGGSVEISGGTQGGCRVVVCLPRVLEG